MADKLRARSALLLLTMVFVAAAPPPRTFAQKPLSARLPIDVLDALPPTARIVGTPGTMRVQAQPCRANAGADIRRRVVDIAVQEWAFFGYRLAAPADSDDTQPGNPNDSAESDEDRRRRRPRLPPEEAARVASSIAGYWAVTPEGAWIVARQNERWSGEDGIAARWNAPWSAAFISWVMCEAGLSASSQFQRSIAHHAYIDQAIRARDGAAPQAAFAAYDTGDAAVEPGDLLCSSRRPAYRTIAERRRQAGIGARSHCDIVVSVDTRNARVLALGGNVRGVVSLKLLPATRQADGSLRPGTGDEERPMFAHLKLRAPSIGLDALSRSPAVSTSGCLATSAPAVLADRLAAARATGRAC
jgi:hypothetical protein